MSKQLVDTNIFVYGIDENSQFFGRARQVLDASEKQLVTTSKNLGEFLAVVTRSTGYALPTEEALEILDEIIQSVEVIYPNDDSLSIFLELIHRYQPKGLKVHDFEIISIGLAQGIHEVATFNTSDFKTVKEISLLDL